MEIDICEHLLSKSTKAIKAAVDFLFKFKMRKINAIITFVYIIHIILLIKKYIKENINVLLPIC